MDRLSGKLDHPIDQKHDHKAETTDVGQHPKQLKAAASTVEVGIVKLNDHRERNSVFLSPLSTIHSRA